MLNIQVGDTVFEAELENNSSAKALKEKLDEPLVLTMRDYGNFEKVGELPWNLPQNNTQITTEPGDIILYLGNQLVIYYDTNSWNFTPIGKIKNVDKRKLRKALGQDNVTVKFSLSEEDE